MNLKTLIFTNSDCYKKGDIIVPKGIMVHSTGANNPNLKRYVGPNDGLLGENANKNYWNKSGLDVCVHAFIGKLADGSIATYQVLPFNYKAWHCGNGSKGKSYSANNTHISFEICEDNLTSSEYFSKVYQEAVEFCVYLCKEFGFNPLEDGVIICHKEGNRRGVASNHGDVEHWFPKFGKTMDDFRQEVYTKLNEEEDDNMTQEKFNEMMNNYLKELNTKEASDWGEEWQEALKWNEEHKLIQGNELGQEMYQAFLTRQMALMMAYRASKE